MYTVYVIDHFQAPDEDDTCESGTFATYEAAEAKCREIIDGYFEGLIDDANRLKQYEGGITPENLFKDWRYWGETPFIKPAKKQFDADDYARKKSAEAL